MLKRFSVITVLLSSLLLTTANAGPINYSYDAAGRLIEADYGSVVITYQYDNNGNLTLRQIATQGGNVILEDNYD